MHSLYCIILGTFFLFACSGSSEPKEIPSSSNINLRDSLYVSSENEQNQATNRIEKKYGAQWDFCDCVKKNDSIDKVIKKNKLTDQELEVILKRADVIDKKCKLFLTDLQSKNPSDRSRHQAKVKSCLEN